MFILNLLHSAPYHAISTLISRFLNKRKLLQTPSLSCTHISLSSFANTHIGSEMAAQNSIAVGDRQKNMKLKGFSEQDSRSTTEESTTTTTMSRGCPAKFIFSHAHNNLVYPPDTRRMETLLIFIVAIYSPRVASSCSWP